MVTVVTIGLIQLVAALNILITLVMMVMEKHRDIAILMSMGASAADPQHFCVRRRADRRGGHGDRPRDRLCVCYFAEPVSLVQLDQQIYSIAYVPFRAATVDGIWIAAAAMVVSIVATLYPATSASRVAPAEALRYE